MLCSGGRSQELFEAKVHKEDRDEGTLVVMDVRECRCVGVSTVLV
jgi:hypothetical protein